MHATRSLAARSVAMLIVAIPLAACSGHAQAPSQPPARVGVLTLKAESYANTVSLPGRTTAYMTADVRPQVGGIIQKRLFQEGADVTEGQALYQIDPAPYQAAYDNAQGALASAEAAVLSAQPEAERYTKLAKIDAISQQDLDSAMATLKQDQAAVVTAKANLETARINLAYTRITAPISGRIGASAYTPGALVTASQTTALSTIYQYDPIYVDVTQSSAQLLALRKDLQAGRIQKDASGAARISLTLEDGSSYDHDGTLQFAGVAVDQGTGTVTLRGVVPNPDKLLLPGMYVHAKVEQGVSGNALRVPQQAVSHNSKGDATAWIVDAGNKVQSRTLHVVTATFDDWIVDAGLKPGDRVIVEGLDSIKDGDTVRAEEIDTASTASAPKAASPASPGKA